MSRQASREGNTTTFERAQRLIVVRTNISLNSTFFWQLTKVLHLLLRKLAYYLHRRLTRATVGTTCWLTLWLNRRRRAGLLVCRLRKKVACWCMYVAVVSGIIHCLARNRRVDSRVPACINKRLTNKRYEQSIRRWNIVPCHSPCLDRSHHRALLLLEGVSSSRRRAVPRCPAAGFGNSLLDYCASRGPDDENIWNGE